ncbi:MAG: hypothetical protein AB1898_17675 [Acidobacteriota bacterium]
MNTATRLKTRGTIIKVPDSTPGLLFVNNEQKAFTLEGIWKSGVAPAANMAVDVEVDGFGNITGLTVVDAQQIAKEKLNQFSGLAQEQGKQAAVIARQGIGALAARMGKVPLGATVVLWVSWFFLPAVTLNLGFLGSKSFTFWDLLAIDLGNLMNTAAGTHGLFAFLGLASIAAPLAAPFVMHPRANYLNATPLAYLLLTYLKMRWDFSQAFGKAAGEVGTAMKEMGDMFSIGVGFYLLILASIVLTVHAFKRRTA